MAGGMAMSGKSINLNYVSPIPRSNTTEVIANPSMERSKKSARKNDMLVAKNLLTKLYHKKFANSVEENTTVAFEATTNSSMNNQTDYSSIKSQAMNMLADLYHEKQNAGAKGRWRRSSISQNASRKSNYIIQKDDLHQAIVKFDAGSNAFSDKASLYSFDKQTGNRENNSLSRSCEKISTSTRYVQGTLLTY